MTVSWANEEAALHTAECVLGAGVVVHLIVESLGEHGWDWQVWNAAGHCRTHYGVADTLRAAKMRAELALVSELTSRGKRGVWKPGCAWRLSSQRTPGDLLPVPERVAVSSLHCAADVRRRGRGRLGRDAALLLAGADIGGSDAHQRSGQEARYVTLCEG